MTPTATTRKPASQLRVSSAAMTTTASAHVTSELRPPARNSARPSNGSATTTLKRRFIRNAAASITPIAMNAAYSWLLENVLNGRITLPVPLWRDVAARCSR